MKKFVETYRYPIFVVAVTLLVRILYLVQLSHSPGFSVPMVDEKWHWQWAHKILSGPFWGEGAYFRAPLYPYLLAFFAWITNSSIFWSKLLQIFICGGTAFFIYRLGEHLFSWKEGVIAGLIYAFYGTLLYYEAMFLIPVVFLFFTVWGMYRLIVYKSSESIRTWLFTGIIFGLAAISRPNILLVMPLLLLWLLFIPKKSRLFTQRFKKPLLVGIGLILVITPVTVRNLLITGDFILISSQGGVNFYIGNNEVANGLTMLIPEIDLNESISWSQFIPATNAVAQRIAGRELTDAEVSSFWTKRTLDFIKNNPGKFLGLTWRKFVYLINGFENSDNSDIYYERKKSSLYSLLLWDYGLKFPFGLLFPLTLVGMYLRRKDFAKLLPVYLFILGYIPTIVLFLVTARHRLPLVPFLAIIAAGGLTSLAHLIRTKQHRLLLYPVVIFVVSIVIVNRLYYEEGGSNQFQIHFNAGIKNEHLENYAEAEKEYLEADKYFPYSSSLLNNLGHVQFLLKKYDDADRSYHRSLRLDSTYFRTYNNLGQLVQEKQMLDSAIVLYNKAIQNFNPDIAKKNELGQIYTNLAAAYEQAGKLDSAADAFYKALNAAPEMGKTYFRAAAFFARHEQYDIVDTLYIRGMYFHELSATDYFNWGLSYLERKRFSDGIGMMFRALKRDTALYQAYYCIAFGLYEGGYATDTVQAYLDRCLNIAPDYEPAITLKKELEK